MNASVWNKIKPNRAADSKSVVRSNIGLEIAQQSLNMVQLEQNDAGKIRISDWVSIPFAQTREDLIYNKKEFKHLVKSVKEFAQFRGKKINAMMPASELKILSVNFETKDGQDASYAIANIVADRVEGPLSDYVIDYLPVRRAEKHGKGLAVVAIAKQKNVTAYLDSLYGAGLEVMSMDIGPAAIKRLVTAIDGTQVGETVLVINFGNAMSYLSIISGRRLLFDEELKFGESELVNEIASALDMDTEVAREQVRLCGLGSFGQAGLNEAKREVADTLLQILRPSFKKLADSLKRALVYAVAETRGEPISQIYLVGSVARWRGVADVLTGLMNLPVTILPDPIARFGDKFDEELPMIGRGHPEMALATGLALRDLDINGKYRPGS
ncbi:MAG: pilus assembly protein PilM [Pseudomonadales bacterium]